MGFYWEKNTKSTGHHGSCPKYRGFLHQTSEAEIILADAGKAIPNSAGMFYMQNLCISK
jgi:hypothetical protein